METKFGQFLKEVEHIEFDTNTTSTGTYTIQQSQRNALRKQGLAALLADLQEWYGDDFDIVETKDGIIIVAENEPCDVTVSWEIKTTIKSLDFDPFIEASSYESLVAEKEEKKRQKDIERKKKEEETARKREKKLAELAKKKEVE